MLGDSLKTYEYTPDECLEERVSSSLELGLEGLKFLNKMGIRISHFDASAIDRILNRAWWHKADDRILRELRLLGSAAGLANTVNSNVIMQHYLKMYALTNNIAGLRELRRWGVDARAIRETEYAPLRLAARENNSAVLKYMHSHWDLTPDDIKASKALEIAQKYTCQKSANALSSRDKEFAGGYG